MTAHSTHHKQVKHQLHTRLFGFLISALGIILFGIVILGISLYGLDKPTSTSNESSLPELYVIDPAKTNLTVELKSTNLVVGQRAEMVVKLNAVTPVRTVTAVLKYDPALVTMEESADAGVFATMTQNNDSTGGLYRLNFMPSLDNSSKTVQGAHTLATIYFKPKAKTADNMDISVLCGAAGQSVVMDSNRQQALSCEADVTINKITLSNISDGSGGDDGDGGDDRDSGGTGGGGQQRPADPVNDPSCHETAPARPTGIQAWTSNKKGRINLAWSKVPNADHYTITYGEKWMEFKYGVPNTGDTNAFEVGNLVPGKLYYFVLTANRGCASSGYSDGVNAKAGWGPQLYIAPKTTSWNSQVKATPKPQPTVAPEPTTEPSPIPTLEPTPEPSPVTAATIEEPSTPIFLKLLPWLGLGILIILAIILVKILRQPKDEDDPDEKELPQNLFEDDRGVHFNSKDR